MVDKILKKLRLKKTNDWRTRRYKNRSRKTVSSVSSRIDSLRSKKMAKYAKLAFIGVVVLSIGLVVAFPLLATTLPSPDEVVRREGFSTKIIDRNGEVLYDIYEEERRTPVEIDQIPEYLKQAVVAIEDKNFYKHSGFDPIGMVRGVSRLFTRGRAQGGSTLTQQLVKNRLLSSERTVTRKIKEFLLATQIENRFTKDEILQMYLNEAPYGGTAWGVEAAAETYFGKKVSNLNMVESAFLAGLPQRPSVYSPYSNTPEAYIGRTQEVLRRMREDGYISREQEEAARDELNNLEFQDRSASFKAPHFVQYVQQILEERYGERIVEQGGLRVTTTLDLELQQKAQEIVANEIEEVSYMGIGNGAAVVLDSKTGEILAMVGSKDFNAPDYDGQVNVTLAQRQPGSSIKPIVYATAFKKGYTASTMVMDVPTKFPVTGQPDYEPVNYDGTYKGPIQLRYALGNSINVPAVKLVAMVGVKDALQTAYEMGIDSLEPTNDLLSRVGLSMALGGGEVRLIELTSAYGVFMNGGKKVEPVAILKVEDSNGKVLEETKLKEGKEVLKPEYAFLIADILSDNSARSAVFGTNSLLNISGRDVAVKTGTTNDKRDNWTVGGTPQVVVGVWVGNNDNSPMKQVASGISGASPIWREILLAALEGKPNENFSVPDGIVTATVDSVSGYRAHDDFPSRSEYFAKGTEPGEDPVHLKLKVCKSEGKLASEGDISSGNYEEKEYFKYTEDDPVSTDGVNRWQDAINAWISANDDPKYHPPTEMCGGGGGDNDQLNLDFESPKDQSSNLGSSFDIRFKVDAGRGLKLAELYIDNKKIRSFTGPPYEYKAKNIEKGVHKIKIVVRDNEDKQSEKAITVGVGVSWDYKEPDPTATPTSVPSPTAYEDEEENE